MKPFHEVSLCLLEADLLCTPPVGGQGSRSLITCSVTSWPSCAFYAMLYFGSWDEKPASKGFIQHCFWNDRRGAEFQDSFSITKSVRGFNPYWGEVKCESCKVLVSTVDICSERFCVCAKWMFSCVYKGKLLWRFLRRMQIPYLRAIHWQNYEGNTYKNLYLAPFNLRFLSPPSSYLNSWNCILFLTGNLSSCSVYFCFPS